MDAIHASPSSRADSFEHRRRRQVVGDVLGAIWYPIRLVLFSVLALFEPLIRIVLAGIAIGGFFAWFVFRVLAHAPKFPTSTVLIVSTGSAVALALYYMLIRWLRP